jgi:hypothetical protein
VLTGNTVFCFGQPQNTTKNNTDDAATAGFAALSAVDNGIAAAVAALNSVLSTAHAAQMAPAALPDEKEKKGSFPESLIEMVLSQRQAVSKKFEQNRIAREKNRAKVAAKVAREKATGEIETHAVQARKKEQEQEKEKAAAAATPGVGKRAAVTESDGASAAKKPRLSE